jgi:beta-lactam-binding protein with PASTA domain
MNKFFKYLASVSFRKNIIIAGSIFILIVFTLFITLRYYTRHGEGNPVPILKGLDIAEAVQLLKEQGYRYQVDSVFILDKKAGLVLEQDPDANTFVKQNRMIYLTIVSSQTPDVNFPDIEHKTFIEAKALLSNYGLKLGDTTYINDIARDAILEFSYAGQSISIGQKIPKGSKIDLVLGNGYGSSEVDLPNITGLTINEAMFSLKGASLLLGNVTYEGTIRDTSNAVIKLQTPVFNPDSLTKVNIGTKINVVVTQQ